MFLPSSSSSSTTTLLLLLALSTAAAAAIASNTELLQPAAENSIGAVPVPFLEHLDPLGVYSSENFTSELHRRAPETTSDVQCSNNEQCSAFDQPSIAFSTGYCDIRTRTCAWGCFRGYFYSSSTQQCAKGRPGRQRPITATISSSTQVSFSSPSSSSTSTSTSPSSSPSADAGNGGSGKSCRLTVDCAGATIPSNSHQWCDVEFSGGVCSWRCNTGYISNSDGSGCTKDVAPQSDGKPSSPEVSPSPTPTPTPTPTPAPSSSLTSTTSSSTSSSTSTPSTNPYLVDVDLTPFGSTFKANTEGWNTNSLVSWYRTNNAADDTNSNSWCYIPYNDATPGFAPSLNTMLSAFDWNPLRAGKNWCGLEAEFTTPDGRKATLYIHDAFDDKWVRTPNAVDVIIGSFPLLFGKSTTNKNDVVQNASWRLTGKRDTRYTFNGGNAVYGVPFADV